MTPAVAWWSTVGFAILYCVTLEGPPRFVSTRYYWHCYAINRAAKSGVILSAVAMVAAMIACGMQRVSP